MDARKLKVWYVHTEDGNIKLFLRYNDGPIKELYMTAKDMLTLEL